MEDGQTRLVQVRGWYGSGKSTAVRQLLRNHGGELVEKRPFTRSNGKRLNAHLWRCDGDLFVIGRYDLDGVSPGSGGDFVNGPVGREIVSHYATQGFPHLVWEGARGSTEWPRDLWLKLGVIWATLDTPLDECLRRIEVRRRERNRNIDAPLNMRSFKYNYERLHDLATRAVQAGMPSYMIDGNRAYEHLRDFLMWSGWRGDVRPVAEAA